MKMKQHDSMLFVWAMVLALSSCGPGQLFGPTVTATPTTTPSPTFTYTPTMTPTLTPSPTLTPTRVTQIFTVNVPANALWFNTGIKIVKGQDVTIRASGNVNTYGGRINSTSDAGGQTSSVCDDSRCPMPGAYYGELIGRLGLGTPFLVDTAFDFTAPGSGALFLSVNDWLFKDNLGEFVVTVTLK